MEKIKILTTQHVAIEFEIASIGDRILATLIDWLILFGCTAVLGGAVAIFNKLVASNSSSGFVILYMVLALPLLFYSFLCELFLNGQSFGKIARKIKVIRVDGTEPVFVNYFMRWIFRLIEVVPYGIIAMVTILVNGKGQRLGDMAAGTMVIRIRENTMSSLHAAVPDNYVIVFNEAIQLTDTEYNLIVSTLESENNPELRTLLAGKIKKNLNIQTAFDDDHFLYTLVADFKALHKNSEMSI
jgi:uncharacterized RDD family membrane protein YckC